MLKTRQFAFTLTGLTPLLMHHDDIDWADQMDVWLKNAKEKKEASVAGDDRSPAFRWIGSCYRDETETNLTIPSDNIRRALIAGAAQVKVGAKGNKTFKDSVVSGVYITQAFPRFTVNGKQIPWAPIYALRTEPDFQKHRAAVEAMGFSLNTRRAVMPGSGRRHVRVRPLFPANVDGVGGWRVDGTVEVTDDRITRNVLAKFFELAGRAGVGDWRPSSPKMPGPYGVFHGEISDAE